MHFMTATSHRIFNLSAAIALSFHWWVWLLFLLAASLPDRLEPVTQQRSRFRSHRGLFHTYSVWIFLGLTIFWCPTTLLTVSGVPLFNVGFKLLAWIYLAGVLCHLLADTATRQGCSLAAVPLPQIGILSLPMAYPSAIAQMVPHRRILRSGLSLPILWRLRDDCRLAMEEPLGSLPLKG
jgi:hypothetical protein